LAARLLMCMPPRKKKVWNNTEINDRMKKKLSHIYDHLYALIPIRNHPVELRLDKHAQCEWERFYNEHAEEQVQLTGALAAVHAKLEAYAARFALIFRFVDGAKSKSMTLPRTVDVRSVKAGITLARWFGQEARRLYAMLQESAAEERLRELAELVRLKGGVVTPRDLQRSSRSFETAEQTEEVLSELVDAGIGHWETQKHKSGQGRPGTVFRLNR